MYLTLNSYFDKNCNLQLRFLQSKIGGFLPHICERLKKQPNPALEGEKSRRYAQATIWSNESSVSPIHTVEHCSGKSHHQRPTFFSFHLTRSSPNCYWLMYYIHGNLIPEIILLNTSLGWYGCWGQGWGVIWKLSTKVLR